MKLTDEQREKASKFIEDNWQGPSFCPVCKNNAWTLSHAVYELRQFSGEHLTFGPHAVAPLIPLTCGNCGNTLLFNALLMGVMKNNPANE